MTHLLLRYYLQHILTITDLPSPHILPFVLFLLPSPSRPLSFFPPLSTPIPSHPPLPFHNELQCAERFAPSTSWYVRTAVRVFELAGDKVKPSVAQTLMQLIAEGISSFTWNILSFHFNLSVNTPHPLHHNGNFTPL